MARSSAVTVNFLADTSPLKRGVRSINRSLKSVGRGANLQGVSRDISKMNRGIGSLVGGLGHLRMGWFGVGAAAAGALTGAAAAIQRIGGEWDQAVVSIQRGTGLVVSEVDGLERSFQQFASSVPESAEVAAKAYSEAWKVAFGGVRRNLDELTSAQDAEVRTIGERNLGLQRGLGVSTASASAVKSQHSAGPVGRANIDDLYAWVGFTYPGVNAQQFVEEAGKIANQIGDMSISEAAVALGSVYEQTGELTIALQIMRSMSERFAGESGSTRDILDRILRSAKRAGMSSGYGVEAQRVGARRELAKTFGQTGDVSSIAGAIFPDQPGQQALTLDRSALAPVIEEMEGSFARLDRSVTSADTWQATINTLEATLGPGARAIINNVSKGVETVSDVIEEEGPSEALDAFILEGAAWFGRNVLDHINPATWFGAPGVFESLPNPHTPFNEAQDRRRINEAVQQLAIGNEYRDPLNIDKVDPSVLNKLREDIADFTLDLISDRRQEINFLQSEGGDDAVANYLADWISGEFGDEIAASIDYARLLESDAAANVAVEIMQRDAGLRQAAAEKQHDLLITGGEEAGEALKRGARTAAEVNIAAADYAASTQRRLSGMLAFMAADMAGAGIATTPDFTGTLNEKDLAERLLRLPSEFEDLGNAARGAAQSLYDLEDGMHILADGVIFREAEILSQATDPDGITSYTTGVGGIVPKIPNRADTSNTNIVADSDIKWGGSYA